MSLLESIDVFFSKTLQFPFVHAVNFLNAVTVKQMVSTPSTYKNRTRRRQAMFSAT